MLVERRGVGPNLACNSVLFTALMSASSSQKPARNPPRSAKRPLMSLMCLPQPGFLAPGWNLWLSSLTLSYRRCGGLACLETPHHHHRRSSLILRDLDIFPVSPTHACLRSLSSPERHTSASHILCALLLLCPYFEATTTFQLFFSSITGLILIRL